MNTRDKVERWAPLVAGLLFVIPVLAARYPPMTDLALHEAVVAVLRHFDDPKYFAPGLYRYNLGHPNQLFYFIAWPLSYLVGTSWAMKLVVAGTQMGLFLAGARLARYFGTPRWTALLVGLLGLGWFFYWGLIANLLGLAIFLTVLPTLDRFVTSPTPRRAAAAFGILLLLYGAHESLMVCAAFMIALFALGHPLPTRAFVLRLAPPVAMFGVTLLQIWWGQRLRAPYNQAVGTTFDPIGYKVSTISGVLFAGYEPYVRNLMLLLVLMAMVLLTLARWREEPAVRGRPRRELFVRFRFEIFAASLFALYLTMPMTVNGATLFYQRFFPPSYAILAVALAPRGAPSPAWRVPRLICLVAPLASLAIAWPSFVESHVMARDIEALAELTEYNSATALVDVGTTPTLRLFSASTFEGHVLAMRGGRTLFDFTRSPIAPAFMNPAYAWDEPWGRLQYKPIFIRPEHDCDYFRYVYFHSAGADLHRLAIAAMEPDARLVGTRGEWSLFESKHLKHGVLSPDGHLPYPRPHTLRKKMKDVLRKVNGEAIPAETPQEPPPGWVGQPLALPDPGDDPGPPEALPDGGVTGGDAG